MLYDTSLTFPSFTQTLSMNMQNLCLLLVAAASTATSSQ